MSNGKQKSHRLPSKVFFERTGGWRDQSTANEFINFMIPLSKVEKEKILLRLFWDVDTKQMDLLEMLDEKLKSILVHFFHLKKPVYGRFKKGL